jgi:hypothetical protein
LNPKGVPGNLGRHLHARSKNPLAASTSIAWCPERAAIAGLGVASWSFARSPSKVSIAAPAAYAALLPGNPSALMEEFFRACRRRLTSCGVLLQQPQ